jgi:hypothetical protein
VVVGTGLGCGGCSFHEGPGGSSGVAREARRVASRCGGAGSAGAAWAQEGVGARTTATRV